MAKKRKKRSKSKWSLKRFILITITGFTITAAAILAIYMMFLSNRIDKRFAGRRWNIPSRVYSDTILMYKGQQINPALFVEKLTRLGYRKTDRSPEHQGEMQVSGRRINIYLHDQNYARHGIHVFSKHCNSRFQSPIWNVRPVLFVVHSLR